MEETAFTNILSTFCHRMTNDFTRSFLLLIVKENNVTILGRKAGKMRKVTVQALLSLVVLLEKMTQNE
jgi:hypothetical protein